MKLYIDGLRTIVWGVIEKEDFERLKAWIEASPSHRVLFEQTLRLYKEGREIGFLSAMDEECSWKSLERKLGRRHRLTWTRWIVAASILLAGVVGGGILLLPEWENDSSVQVFSEIPGKATVILRMADGKSVSLKENETIGLVEKDGTEIHKDTMNRLVYAASNTEKKSVLHTLEVPVGGESTWYWLMVRGYGLIRRQSCVIPLVLPGKTGRCTWKGKLSFPCVRIRHTLL